MKFSGIPKFFVKLWKFLVKLRKNYIEFLFGLVVGFGVFMIILEIAIPLLIALMFMNLLLTMMSYLKISGQSHSLPMPKIQAPIQTINDSQRKVCPECGSPARHKKGCSRGKKV